MRIGLVFPYFEMGLGLTEEHLARGLSKRHRVFVYASDRKTWRFREDDEKLPRTEKHGNLTIKRFPALFEVKFLPYVPGLKSEILKDDLDVIHTQEYIHQVSWSAFSAAKKKDIPFVLTHQEYRSSRNPLLRTATKIVEKTIGGRIVRDADALTAIHEDARDFLIEKTGVDNKKVKIVPLAGVDTKEFSPGRSDFKKKRGIKRAVLYVGRFAREKNVDLLVKAFAKIEDKDLRLILVGDGAEREKIEKLVTDVGVKDRVIFTGMVSNEDLPDIYRAAEVFAMPSKNEPWGLVFLEAMACGVPVLAGGGPGPRAIVGEGGLIVDTNVKSVKKGLEKMLGKHNLKPRQRALQMKWSKIIDAYCRIYKTLL